MIRIFVLVFIILLSGCATAPIAREPSEYLLNTDKSTTVLFNDLKAKFEENKYRITKLDVGSGLFLTAPRKFSFEKGGKKIAAHQKVEIRQEGGSLKLRIVYACNYLADGKVFQPCHRDDSEANTKIRRVEPGLLAMLRPLLMKHGDNETGPDLEADWGDEVKKSEEKSEPSK